MEVDKKKIRAEYNKKYYESKKADIAKKLYAKEPCRKCGRIVSHQNLPKHMNSRYCKDKSGNLNEKNEIQNLKEQIEQLSKLIESKLT
jgi:hypothetical protein